MCYPQTYEEHYLRVFVKDVKKQEAAAHAFSKVCKTYSNRFSLDVDAVAMGSPTKDRQYPSQRFISR